MHLITRAGWGARPYRTPSGATRYARPRRGVKIHYLGSHYTDRPHDRCAAYVRSLQDSHMDGNGWSDIGYSFVVCTHGHVFEGRGLDRRNSANGNTSLNEQDYAVCALVGSSGLTEPTDAQLHGLRDAIDHCRREGAAGPWLGGHKDGYPTNCPGGPLYAWVQAGAPRPQTTPASTPPPATEEEPVPLMLSESRADDTQLSVTSWVDLPFADAVIHKGPREHVTVVHLQLAADTPPDAEILGRFYLANADGTAPSAYLPIRHVGPGPHQFVSAAPIPEGRYLRFQALAVTQHGESLTVTHRTLSGPYWTV